MKIQSMAAALLLLSATVCAAAAGPDRGSALTLTQALEAAVSQDPWLSGSQYREQALRNESVAAAALPDPKVSLAASNFPVDTFDIHQEPMTQLTVGITQMFPRGDSRGLGRRQKQELAAQEPLLRQDREARVTTRVTQLWLEVFRAQETIRLIGQDRALFEHLADATVAGYASASGGARQQDIIRAQLEITRLEDRLTVVRQQQDTAREQLAEWIGAEAQRPLPQTFPDDWSAPALPTETGSDQTLYRQIRHHPALLAFDQRIDAMDTGVELARQKYRPEWGLFAQYGYREDDLTGRDRADLFTVGVTFDVPLFPGNRQDKDVGAASARAEALKTEKLLLARQMMAELETAMAGLRRLEERQALYSGQLLPQMAEQADAALTAYNNDDGDFTEAIRARIDELNARIDYLSIRAERLKTIAGLQYLLTVTGNEEEGFQP